MVGVLVDHDLIATPVPALDDGVIVRGDVPVIITKPEAFPVSSRHHEYMLRSKATGEASVCPRLIEAEIPIVGATIMSDPLIVAGVNVRELRMTSLVHGNAVPGRGIGLLPSCRSRIARRPGSRRRSRTASWNVSTANRGRATAAAWLPTAPLILRKSSHANQNRYPYNLFHINLPGEISPIKSVARHAPTQTDRSDRKSTRLNS